MSQVKQEPTERFKQADVLTHFIFQNEHRGKYGKNVSLGDRVESQERPIKRNTAVESCGVRKGGSGPLGVALLRLQLHSMCKDWQR